MLLRHLETCSDKLFVRYFKALMIDTGLPASPTLDPTLDDDDKENDGDPPVFETHLPGEPYLCAPGRDGMYCRRTNP